MEAIKSTVLLLLEENEYKTPPRREAGRHVQSMSSQLESVLARKMLAQFLRLPPDEQLDFLVAAHDHVGRTGQEAPMYQRNLALQAEALKAVGTIAAHIGNPRGVAPTTTEYRRHQPSLAPEWSLSRVIRVFGRWKFARQAYGGNRPTAVAQASRLRRVDGTATTDDADYTLAKWLAANPGAFTTVALDGWVDEQRLSGRNDGRLLKTDRICKLLGLKWPQVVPYARGELTLEEARLAQERLISRPRTPDNHGPDDLVPTRVAREMLGLAGDGAAIARLRAHGLPPALTTTRLKLWRREDVLAVAQGNVLHDRVENELRAKYLTADELAPIVGLNRTNLRRAPRVPEPVMSISGSPFWLRETFLFD